MKRTGNTIRMWLTIMVILATVIFIGEAPSPTFGEDLTNREKMITENMFLFEHVYFKSDSTDIIPAWMGVLDRKAEWLIENSEVSIIIEGHCDARGSNEFNLILGEARAGKVKGYLIRKGVSGSRILTISYGEEDPADSGQNEEAWAKNRRVRFLINKP